MIVVAKIFEPLIDVWEYTFACIFLMLGFILWEFSRNTGVISSKKLSTNKTISTQSKSSVITDELKQSVIDAEILENPNIVHSNEIESDEVNEEIIVSNENPFSSIIETLENDKAETTETFKDTQQIILNDESELGYFAEGDLPDNFIEDDLWDEDAIEIITDDVPSTEQIENVKFKIESQIPLDVEEMRIYEYYTNSIIHPQPETENIFADYNH